MRGTRTPPPQAIVQGGVFTAAQARQSGYSSYRIRNLVRDGRWVVVLGSVYADRSVELTQSSLARAGALAAGTGSVVSHVTAARMHGLDVPRDSEVHVIVDPETRLRIAGLRTHRVSVDERDLEVLDGVPCTSLKRTVVDCLLWLPEEAGRALLVSGLRRRRTTISAVRSELSRVGQRHGLARAWSVVRDLADSPFSEAEVRLHRLLHRRGVTGWTANSPIWDGAGLVGIGDIVFDDVPLVLELDGRAYHSDDPAFQRDRDRQNRLVLAGYTVLRFTWDDVVSRPDAVVGQIEASLRSLRRGRRQGAASQGGRNDPRGPS